MAENGITDPLLPPSFSSDHITLNLSQPQRSSASSNPFHFIGCSEPPSVPPPSTVDPFWNGTQNVEGLYECVKIVACLPLALLRVVVFGVCLMIGYLATKLALLGWKEKENPMPGWRSRVMWITRICARFILFSFGYQWIKRRGKPAPREIAPIIVSNHVSYIEPIFYFYELFPTIVASESHDSIPWVGTIIRAMQVIYVNRFSPSSRREAVNEIKRRASCNGYPPVLLFPEGTTTNGRCLISFQLGAFIPGYPIQPIVVRYPHVHFDQSWGSISLGKLMFRMFTQFHNFFEVEYLPVIYPRDDKLESAAYYAERTGHAMATALNVVKTEHSYGDLMLHVKAQEAKQEKPSSYMVEMSRVEKLFKLSSTEALDFLDRFLSMNPDPSGRVQYHNFLRGLKLKTCPLSEKIFAFLDVEMSGTITFSQFLFGSAHVMKHPGFHHSCESAFSSCSSAVKDYIIEEELRDFIQPAIPGWKDYEVHELLVLFDGDSDGKIGKDDFHSCLRRNPLLIAFFNPHHLHHHTDIGGSENLQIL
ncbi:Lysophospholipid acyltransferase lpeat2 [Stylosanthes scabra]|uniref:Lysophospholipid acyltransferase lpeat2 n=1 Tax=Stylosanthes scabra TaxID=79078 RepID=A0ABU6WBA7_9FABA|nr:Lysophospholipid acyltransferase lpeat2 [Stylosanthes scabra]